MKFEKEIEDLIKCYFLYQLAALYQTDARTFKKWLEPFATKLNYKKGTKYTPRQVRIIFEHLDAPNLAAYR